METKTKNELLELAGKLAEKHAELKSIVMNMVDEMDKIELKYNKIIDEIKKK